MRLSDYFLSCERRCRIACLMLLLPMIAGVTTACAQIPSGRPDSFEARSASMSAQADWIKKDLPHTSGAVYVAPHAFITHNDVVNATFQTDVLGRPFVVLDFKPASAIRLMAATARQENTHIALLINGDVVAIIPAARPITGHRIAVDFQREDDARQFAGVLSGISQ